MRLIYREIGRDPLFKVWNASDEDMIICFHSDGGSLVFGNAIYPIEQGAVCFVAAGSVHYTMPDDPQCYERSKLFFPRGEFRALLEALSHTGGLSRLFRESEAVYAKIPACEEPLLNELLLRAERGGEERAASLFLHLLTLIYENTRGQVRTPDSFMARAVEYVNSSYAGEIALDDLCRLSNMSKSSFCRKFKAALGMSVMEYLLKTRIAAAKSLLLAGELSVSEISERCGFSSVAYFCRRFKEETGVSAGEFRRGKG